MAATATKPRRTAPAKKKAPAKKPPPAPVEVQVGRSLARQLLALTRCAETRIGARPVLACMRFEGAQAVATDSYVLGFINLGDDVDIAPCEVSAPALARALRLARHPRKNPDSVTLRFESDHVVVTIESRGLFGAAERTSVALPHAEGVTYPDFRKLVHEFEGCEGHPPVWNPDNVARIAALREQNGRVPTPVSIRWYDPMRPFRVEQGDRLLGLVMPMRND